MEVPKSKPNHVLEGVRAAEAVEVVAVVVEVGVEQVDVVRPQEQVLVC